MVVWDYIQCRPAQLEAAIAECPLAFIPVGALEWHSYHMPLGLDGLKAEALLRLVATRLNKGVFFPCRYYGSFDTMHFPFTFFSSRWSQTSFYYELIAQMYSMGFRVIVIITGHYPSSQVNMLKKVAFKFMNRHPDASVLAIPEQTVLWDLEYYGDHAAHWETSLALALFPDIVDLNALPEGLSYIERCQQLGIMGKDPKQLASAELGKNLVDKFVERLVSAIDLSLSSKSQAIFREIYQKYDAAVRKLYTLKDLGPALNAMGMAQKQDFFRWLKWQIFHYARPEKKVRNKN